jgi:hypothetical protein
LATQRNGDWSIGELVSELTRNLSILIRGEIALVRLEIRNAIAQLGAVIGLMIVAGLLAFCGYIFFLMMLHSLFVQILPRPWLGELVVMAILLATAGGLGWAAMAKLDKWKTTGVHPAAAESEEKTAANETTQTEEPSDGIR